MAADSRNAFTLLEVIIALMLGATVIMGARALLEGVTLQAQRVASMAGGADSDANMESILRSAFARAGLSTNDSDRFDGTPHQARFATWCDTAGGWQERCVAQLIASDVTRADSNVVLDLGNGRRFEVIRAVDESAFRYLASAADGGHWVNRWEGTVSLPMAIEILVRRSAKAPPETTFIRIGRQ